MFSETRACQHSVLATLLTQCEVCAPSIAAELSPYSLPSQQRYVPESRIQQQRGCVIFSFFYERRTHRE